MAISQYDNEYYGLSGEVKPLGTPLNGRKFTEMDTSKEYRFDAENQQWLQQSPGGGGGSSTLAGLTDVDITNPTNGQTLVYNASTEKWENGSGGGGGGGVHVIGTQTVEDKVGLTVTAVQLYGWLENGEYALIKTQQDDWSVFDPIQEYMFDAQNGYDFTFANSEYIAVNADDYPVMPL